MNSSRVTLPAVKKRTRDTRRKLEFTIRRVATFEEEIDRQRRAAPYAVCCARKRILCRDIVRYASLNQQLLAGPKTAKASNSERQRMSREQALWISRVARRWAR
jgi:hypothetical protein